MMKRYRNQNGRSGASAVELALLLPFLVFLFVITVDFGRIFYYSLTLTN
jgi:Flp pilus assembly protein TadG